MKINLTAVKNAGYNSTTRTPNENALPQKQPTYYKPLDQNIISVKSNSVHYKIVKEDPQPANIVLHLLLS